MSYPEQPFGFYKSSIEVLKKEIARLVSSRSRISWLRVLIIAAVIAAVILLWSSGFGSIFLAIVPLFALFGFLVTRTLKLDEQLTHNRTLLRVNEEELAGLSGVHVPRFDGTKYLGSEGGSGNDLDIFGPASLYPFLNRANTERGRDLVAKSLHTSASRDQILQKQAAVIELQQQTPWRQQLQAFGMRAEITRRSETVIEKWLSETPKEFQGPVWMILRFLIPAISFTICILYAQDKISDPAFNVSMLLILGFVLFVSRGIAANYSMLSGVVKEMEALGNLLHTIEQQNFNSPLLREQQELLKSDAIASVKIRELKSILNRMDYRLNPIVWVPLSVFFFWDLQQVFSLEKWRGSMKGKITHWYSSVAWFENLSSFANLSFNHPRWAMPLISEQWFELEGKQMGHPLILPSKSVLNDLKISGAGELIMLTGSNMAGKSTFLRTLGTNMILAMAGGPVCADYFKIPVLSVVSSMRIMDNLEEETSTFYAELKKLKKILESIQAREKVFILLDEMLRGTNAIDRHTGSVALIRQLLKFDAVGIIASHDISLTELAKEYPGKIENYHFDSSVINNEIVFDYRLKNGVCTSTNATLLMKKIGLQIDDGE